MAWMDIKGAVVADTVYCDGALCAKDVSFTLPGLSFLSADVQALGNMLRLDFLFGFIINVGKSAASAFEINGTFGLDSVRRRNKDIFNLCKGIVFFNL